MNKFRNDIQGLRALAVLAVIIFHFNATWLPGGFIGVDIFFVISGYLMTSIVISGVTSNKFSLIKFYQARAIRILPALMLLAVIVTIISFAVLNLVDSFSVAESAISSITFISNITYWMDSGYFDEASKLNWLLHTWSLAVEWQFYVIYPLVILTLCKFLSIKNIARLTLATIIVLFLLSAWFSYKSPSASYFLLPSRAWELLAGGLAFFYPLNSGISDKTRKYAVSLGFMVLIGSSIFITQDVAWPGMLASIPVFATLIIIVAHDQNNKILSNNVSQMIGAWSYSLYLWHWPVVVFIRYFELPTWSIVPGLLLTFLLGWLSFTYCESMVGKLRTNNKKNSKRINGKHIAMGFVGMIILLFTAIHHKDQIIIDNINTIESFLPGQQYIYDNRLIDAGGRTTHYINGANSSDVDYIAIGDSNLGHYSYGMAKNSNEKIIISWEGLCLSFSNYITRPTEKYMTASWAESCKGNYKKVLDYPNTPIILAHDWRSREMTCVAEPCVFKSSLDNYFSIVEQQLDVFHDISGMDRTIFLIGQIPAPIKSQVQCLKGFAVSKCNSISVHTNSERKKVNDFLMGYAKDRANVTFINPFDAVCNEEYECKIAINNKSLFHDASHLSAFGSAYFWDFISLNLKDKTINN